MLKVKTVLLKTIQFSTITPFKCQKSSISINLVYQKYSFLITHWNVKAVNFKQFTLVYVHNLVLFAPQIWLYQVLPLRARADLGEMAVKVHPEFPKAPSLLQPHHQIDKWHIQDTHWGSLTPLQRCSCCILQPQPNGPRKIGIHEDMYICICMCVCVCMCVWA